MVIFASEIEYQVVGELDGAALELRFHKLCFVRWNTLLQQDRASEMDADRSSGA